MYACKKQLEDGFTAYLHVWYIIIKNPNAKQFGCVCHAPLVSTEDIIAELDRLKTISNLCAW